jgi:ABC-type glutathione transport system ATPase component
VAAPLLEIRAVSKSFRSRSGSIQAVDNVSLSLWPKETLALVGESGSGKSTLARLALRLLAPDSGQVLLEGVNLASLSSRGLRACRRNIQLVAQDPLASLDPLMTIGRAVVEGLEIYRPAELPRPGRARLTELLPQVRARHLWFVQRARELLEAVGLDPALADAYPAQLSGGQRQRVSIARALALQPKLLVLDEPLASLDVATSAQILQLLVGLQAQPGSQLAYLFITHDLDVAAYLAHRIAVMRQGKLVETGEAQAVLTHPQHDYTRELTTIAIGHRETGPRRVPSHSHC